MENCINFVLIQRDSDLHIHTFNNVDDRWHNVIVHVHQKVIFEEYKTDDGEQIDENQRQYSGEYNRSTVSRNRSDDIQQSFLTINHIEQLQKQISHKSIRYIPKHYNIHLNQIEQITHQNGEEERMTKNARHTEEQIKHMINQLCIR